MAELHKVGERTYYIEAPTNLGIYLHAENKVCMIDSGGDETAAKEALGLIKSQGWTLTQVFNTHSHADHMGGSAYLVRETGCKLYAPGADCDIVNHAFLNSTYLFGGFSMEALHHKFIYAESCPCDMLTEEALPEGLTFTYIRGHSFDMAAFKTSDGVWFLADSVLGEAALTRYKITFLYDIEEHLKTLDKIKTLSGKLFIPSHTAPVTDIAPLAEKNRQTVFEVRDTIKRLCEAPLSADELIAKLFSEFGIKLYLTQYTLISFTTKSYISWLCDKKEIEPVFDGSALKWKTVI